MKFRGLLSKPVALGICLALVTLSSLAQQHTDYRQENRFLIVVETSSSLRKCTNAVDAAVAELFQSEMKGELRSRDTVGVWTYNEQLHTEFPMQVWKETNTDRILRNVMTYLGEEKYEKHGHLDKVLPVIGKVMGESERLTVIFIFDGNDKMDGTPFDKEINELHKHFAHEFKSKHEPFVTVVSERGGKIFDYTVSSPGTIKLPHTATAWPPPITPPPVVVAPAPAPPAPHKYTEIVMAGLPVHAEPVAPITTAPVVETNQVAAPTSSNPVEQSAPVSEMPLTNAAPTNAVAEVESNKATNAVAAAESSSPSSAPPTTAPSPAAPPAKPWTQPVNITPQLESHSLSEDAALYVIAGSLLAIACMLVWFILKRARGAETASLISQSMDRSR